MLNFNKLNDKVDIVEFSKYMKLRLSKVSSDEYIHVI